ncbi:Formate hydrogenlyase subunit 7 [Novipirellula aureliae]|uniref:Formate hydrogenlyase subunit 7 n=1 Tax=Novipirellula aureliae TaxID=2527966 RepID=A0A5C6DEC0_9BACT|nr:NADH-quinone oxidoreductase subunit NuoB [Novipirellula aureliae]TWU34545.1 Formate hydrogenlyase subunit 7 [Novipirellula aureliae]
MFKILNQRRCQQYRTIDWPDGDAPKLSARYRGLPVIDSSRCPDGCQACVDACPTNAISINGSLKMDLGKCLFCTDCVDACPESAISYSEDFRQAVRVRNDLVVDGGAIVLADALEAKSRKLFGRSLQLRQVSAGGCNACEADINVLSTIGFDLGRFGIHIVASPRHADGLIITGPVTENMKLALKKTYDAIPSPKIVIAVGACAISGGPFIDNPEQNNGVDHMLPVDLYIPGCPPHPLTILDGLLRLLGRIEDDSSDTH